MYSVLSFLWKDDTFLAVYSTLLSNSYLAIYLQKTTTQNGNTKQKKKKEGKKEFGRSRTQHHQLDATTPNHYTTKTDYVIVGKVFNLMPFP